ncbi:MAG: class I SAM-dependent methyltransferase [Acidobacteria bacterium]|nr:class I SAM-dependent methyltransferase [Acidobacteriota bacterium]
MALRLDADNHEIAALADFLPARGGLRVLEIGCGDGRMTRRYAHIADRVLAVDSSAEQLDEFRASMPLDLRGRIELRAGPIETLQIPDEDFDVVLMSWSL